MSKYKVLLVVDGTDYFIGESEDTDALDIDYIPELEISKGTTLSPLQLISKGFEFGYKEAKKRYTEQRKSELAWNQIPLGQPSSYKYKCPVCSYVATKKFKFCPECGTAIKLKDKRKNNDAKR